MTDPSWRLVGLGPCSAYSLGVRSEDDVHRAPSGRPILHVMSERSSDRGTIPSTLHGEALGLASLLANETRDGVAIVGPDGKLIFWNAAAGAITGWSSQAVAER